MSANRLRVIFQLGDSQTKTIGMEKICLISAAIVLLVAQGSDGNKLGVAPSLRELLTELMQNGPTSGICGNGCYMEIAGETKYFEDDYVDPSSPCTVYFCDSAKDNVETQTIKCANQPCESQSPPVYLPGICCPQCEGEREPQPKVTEWSEWTQCSVTCGRGRKARSRTCIVPANAPDVGECTGVTLLEFEDCNLTPCPVGCEWEYGPCGSCSATCGSGTKSCRPVITQQVQHGGRECPDFVRNGEPRLFECTDLLPCPPVHCEWEYRGCGSCSATCGSGTRQCTPVITQQAQHGGRECPDFVRNGQPQQVQCTDLQPCPPIDCKWKYEICGSCSATCGSGTRQCTPVITQQAHRRGRECPDFVRNGEPQQVQCKDLPSCPPINCEWEYGPCGKCSTTCGSGTKQCPPVITRQPRHGGNECPDFVRNRQSQPLACTDLSPCPVCPVGHHECRGKDGRSVCLRDSKDTNCECLLETLDRNIDWDGDFVRNDCDNCPKTHNFDQVDTSNDGIGDGIGDACEYTGPTNGPFGREQEVDGQNEKDISAAIMKKLLEMLYSE